MLVFISGGCKNGKSTHAEKIAVSLAEVGKPLYYIATMRPADEEDRARILQHRQSRRGLGFETVELGENIPQITTLCDPGGTFLLDSVTALLANELFLPGGEVNRQAPVKVAEELALVCGAVANLVLVSDFIYCDALPYDELTETYRKGLAFVDRRCAARCDLVLEGCCGSLIVHKGRALAGGIL